MSSKLTFVLDTSVFTNPQLYKKFSQDVIDAAEDLLYLMEHSGGEFYMPLSTYDELQKMLKLGPLTPKFELVVKLRNPKKFLLTVPAEFLYKFISDLRNRINKGLRVAEEHVRSAQGREKESVGEVIRSLREKYREALRQGILDSKEDVDVILLAYELDAVLVSADEGIRNWAKELGVKLINPEYFKELLEEMAARQSGRRPPL
ncbi:MAG: RNA ligase partner protein [Aquificae bacterium]|nr:RNA ligase partner protein [Aquificota bacterium]